MHHETPPRQPHFLRRPRSFAIALTLPALLLAGALLLGDGTGRGTAGDAAFAASPEPPEEEAATFAAYLAREPDGPLLDALDDDQERERVQAALQDVYDGLGHRPLWIRDGRPSQEARELVEALRRASEHGLHPATYQPDLLARRLEALGPRPRPEEVIELDVLLSRALLVYGEHLAGGRIDPRSLGPAWLIEPREPELGAALETVPRSGALPAVDRLRPPHPGYEQLRQVLGRYREIHRSGGWPTVPEGPVLSAGDGANPERLRALAQRLEAEGDLREDAWRPAPADAPDGGDASDTATYDDTLAAAVERFQERMGLTVDGMVGPNTTEALNRSASHRLRQIELNLERWRWLPADLGERYVAVNLPGFLLHAVEDDRIVQAMKVVVGKSGAATPAFSDRMTYVVINPYWNVPNSIVALEIAPKVIDDPGYLAANDYEVVSGWGENARTVSPHQVSWHDALDQEWDYRVRQRPGPGNALGQIKFMFPNDHNIYLHDTPAEHLFEEAERTFSHGCIRVERPLELAEFVFQGDPEWNRSRVRSAIASGQHRQVELPEEVPVYLLYWTAWVDESGTVHFRQDVYGHDHALDQALDDLAPERSEDRLASR